MIIIFTSNVDNLRDPTVLCTFLEQIDKNALIGCLEDYYEIKKCIEIADNLIKHDEYDLNDLSNTRYFVKKVINEI